MITLVPLALGYLLDAFIGDPEWLWHPVRLMGAMISRVEPRLRKIFPKTPAGELAAGGLLAISLPVIWLVGSWALLQGARLVHPVLGILLESWMCFQILAVHSLQVESMRVYRALHDMPLSAAQKMVGRIVGRDTDCLDASGVAKATIETVAENTGDGIVSPLLFIAIGGAPLGFFFKMVSTLDSMVGYQNEQYRYFGRVSARFDDLLNFIPARLCGGLMTGAAFASGLDTKSAWTTFLQDRKKHPSPNSAHPEAASAGALGVALGGDTVYGGVVHKKQTIGRMGRVPTAEDIPRANCLMQWTGIFALLLALGIRAVFF